MSDKVLCPKGSKVCPKCKTFVKGPRTKVCGGCGHVFVKSVAAVVKAKTNPVVEPVVIPDPYTFHEVATRKAVGGTVTVRRAAGIFVQPNNTQKVASYVANLGEVPISTFENDVVMV